MDEFGMSAPQEPSPEPPAAEPNPVFREARRAYSMALLSIVLYALIGKVLRLLIVFVLKKTGLLENLSETLTYIVMFAPMYLVAFPLYLLISKPFKKCVPPPRTLSPSVMGTAFLVSEGLAVSGALIGSLVTTLISVLLGNNIFDDTIQQGVTGDGVLVFTLAAALFAPIIEEMLFRKVLIDRIRVYGDGTAILLSGLFFGLFHGNFMQFFFAAMIGTLLAYIYVRTGKIRYTIAIHMTINSLSSIAAGYWMRMVKLENLAVLGDYATSGEIENGLRSLLTLFTEMLTSRRLNIPLLAEISVNEPARMLFFSMPGILGLLLHSLLIYTAGIAGLILLLVHRKQFHVEKPQISLGKGGNRKAVLTGFGFWAMTGLCIWLFISNIFG